MSRLHHLTKAGHGNGSHKVFRTLPADLLRLHRRAIAHGWQRSDHLAIAAAFKARRRWAAAGLWERLALEVGP